MLRRVLAAGIGIALVGSLAYAAFAGPLVSVFYGHAYERAVPELRLVAAALAVLGVHTLLQYWWLGAGLPRLPAISLGCGAAITAAIGFSRCAASRGHRCRDRNCDWNDSCRRYPASPHPAATDARP
jgi:O-antigen/teichoic acid export membrane protein